MPSACQPVRLSACPWLHRSDPVRSENRLSVPAERLALRRQACQPGPWGCWMKCISLGSDFPSWAPGGGPAVASAKVSEVAASATVLRQRWQAWAWRCSASTLRGGRVSPSRCCVGSPIADDFTTPMGPWGPPRRRDIDSLPLPPRVATAIAHLFNRRIGCVLVSREPRGECHMAGDTQKKRAQCRRCG